jgi:hypothetical protein
MRFQLGTVTPEQLVAFYRVSTRLDRAVEMIDKVHDNAPGIAIVDSQTHSKVRYVTDLRAGTCECPDWTYRGSVTGTPRSQTVTVLQRPR